MSLKKQTMGGRVYSHDGNGNLVTNAGGGVTNAHFYGAERRLVPMERDGPVKTDDV